MHCSDPRFQSAIREFVNEKLGIKGYAPIAIGGGAHAFGAQSNFPGNFNTVWEQVQFFIEKLNVDNIIIINHEDCKWYQSKEKYSTANDLPNKGKSDLQTAANIILKDYSYVNIRTFWAALDGDQITFEEIK